MNHTVEIKELGEDWISLLGREYYTKEYMEEMMRREYQRGLKKGQTVHVAHHASCNDLACK